MLKKILIRIYEFLYELNRIVSIRVYHRLRIMNPVRTLKYILKNNCSVARFGDGEFRLILKTMEDIGFQKQSDALSEKLDTVLKSHNKNVLVCVPRCFNTLRGCNEKAKIYWKSWSKVENHQLNVMKFIQSESGKFKLFGDAQITRPYIDWKDDKRAKKIFPLLKQLWNDRDLIIVEGNQTRLGIGNDLLDNAKSIKRIEAPATDAFDKYEEIIEGVRKIHKDELVLLALGPTATALAYDLSKIDNIQALDVGHIDIEYEWFLMGAKEKTKIEGKFTNEVHGGRCFSQCNDENYLSQIVLNIE